MKFYAHNKRPLGERRDAALKADQFFTWSPKGGMLSRNVSMEFLE